MAANSDVTARQLAASLPCKLHEATLPFSSALVASLQNRRHWPRFDKCDNVVLSPAAAFVMHHAGAVPRALALPLDHLAALVDHVVRQEARLRSEPGASPSLVELHLLPSPEQLVPLDEALRALLLTDALVRSLHVLHIFNAAPATGEESALRTLVERATQLRSVSLMQCGLRGLAAVLFRALRESDSVTEMCVAGNDIGVDADGDVASALCDLVQHNKFLLALDLADNNCTPALVAQLMGALAASDTRLRPSDLPPEPEVAEVSISELVDRDYFTTSLDDDEDEESEVGPSEHAVEVPSASLASSEHGWHDEAEDKSPLASDEEQEVEEEKEEEEQEHEEKEDAVAAESERQRKVAMVYYAREVRRLVRLEARERRALLQCCLEESVATGRELEHIRARRREERRVATSVFCARRSGWSRLQRLVLRGNRCGDRGARAVALVLRDEVPMTDADARRVRRSTALALRKLVDVLASQRLQTKLEERAARVALTHEAHDERVEVLRQHGTRQGRNDARDTPAPAMLAVGPDGDESEYDAPDILLTNVEGGEEEEQEERAEAAAAVAEEDDDDGAVPTLDDERAALGLGAESVVDDDRGDDATESGDDDEGGVLWQLPVPATKPGMNSITYLDLGSCQIGPRGLVALAAALTCNTVLQTLLLRNNPLVGGRADTVGQSSEEALAGVVAFAGMLEHNTTLRRLDLAHCQLAAAAVHHLATALRVNASLQALLLDGNAFCEATTTTPSPATSRSALQALLSAAAKSALRELDLSSNDVGEALWHDEVDALADASATLSTLRLNHAALRGEHVGQWAAALGGRSCTLTCLALDRNRLATESDGAALGALLSRCRDLVELSLDHNPRLTSRGLAVALHAASTTALRSLSCVGVATTADVAGVGLAIPAPMLATLHSLNLADVRVSGDEDVVRWLRCCHDHAHALRFLTLWSRRVDMERCLATLHSLVLAMPALLFVDFGILLRCDGAPDLGDALLVMEQELVGRRLAAVRQAEP